MRSLVLYTYLLDLWGIFNDIVTISPTTDMGFTLSCADVYLRDIDKGNKLFNSISHGDFWRTMIYFLNRTNAKFQEKRKLSLAKTRR